jgi:hypothetical protein
MRQIDRMIMAVLLLLPCCGCDTMFHSSQATWRIDSPDSMIAVIPQHVPVGTSVQEAMKFMEHEGFACTLRRNGTFCEQRGHDPGEKHEGIDFLECHRVQNAGFLMSRVWEVALVLKNDRVTDILVSHWFDGP